MHFHDLYWPAILAATFAAFVIGGLWYSPALFGKVWMRANGFTEADVAKGNKAKIFGVSFLFILIMAINLAMFLSRFQLDAHWGSAVGFHAGLFFIAMGIGVVALFEQRPWSYILVNGGYVTVALIVMGLIIGVWH